MAVQINIIISRIVVGAARLRLKNLRYFCSLFVVSVRLDLHAINAEHMFNFKLMRYIAFNHSAIASKFRAAKIKKKTKFHMQARYSQINGMTTFATFRIQMMFLFFCILLMASAWQRQTYVDWCGGRIFISRLREKWKEQQTEPEMRTSNMTPATEQQQRAKKAGEINFTDLPIWYVYNSHFTAHIHTHTESYMNFILQYEVLNVRFLWNECEWRHWMGGERECRRKRRGKKTERNEKQTHSKWRAQTTRQVIIMRTTNERKNKSTHLNDCNNNNNNTVWHLVFGFVC